MYNKNNYFNMFYNIKYIVTCILTYVLQHNYTAYNRWFAFWFI